MILVVIIILAAQIAFAQVVQDTIPELQRIDVEEHLGQTVPLELAFVNSHGESVKLSDYFHRGKPVILSLYYTNCPMLCSLVLTGTAKAVNSLSWPAGDQFQMLSVSFDPRETPQLAAATNDHYQGMLTNSASADAWEFLVGPESHSQSLAAALGFKYFYIKESGQYAHPAVIFVLTEDGKISRYVYGINFKERDLRLALLEASQGKIGNTVDRIILYCFHYDPEAKGYVMLAGNVMKLGGAVSLILLGLFLGILWSKERFHKRAA